ncbi:MAG: type II toxin-antitoxin system VapC family toxin [Deltaproteobacteria bacterium]|nr:type II toxin-antitoxin system VapC family toxin [Deltaproteobacteria bacterium]
MKSTFVDANVFLRYLTNDDPEKADRVEALLSRAARGEVRLITTELVLAEVVWVLESSYEMNNHEIAPMIKAILDTPGIEVINGGIVEKALDFYRSHNVDFVDGYIAAIMEKRKIKDIYSFDRKHLGRIKVITRKEP